MSESDRAAAETAEGALELTPVSGPGDPSQTSSTQLSKESRRVSSERQFKVERAQKCLENAALVSKRIKEHRRAAAELLGKAFEDDETCDASSDLASVSTRTSYSVATSDAGPPMSVEDALNIPGISESLANTLKQKELLMERIKQYKERSKRERPVSRSSKPSVSSRLPASVDEDPTQIRKFTDKLEPSQLQNAIKEKETALSIMQVKMRAMETTILDLQEKISEKDSLIEAKNRATSLMSDNLSKKENDSVNLLEDTRRQIEKMQENFAAMESEWKEEKRTLLGEIESKNERINYLEEANAILENGRFEISLAHSKLAEEVDLKNKLIFDLEQKLINLSKQNQEDPHMFEEEKGSREISNMVEMTKRLELLEQLNCQIRKTNLELQDKLATLSPQAKSSETAATIKSSPQVSRKHGKSASRNTSAKQKSPWISLAESSAQDADKGQTKVDSANEKNFKLEMIIQSLNKEILDKEFEISQKDTIIRNQLEVIKHKEEEVQLHAKDRPETAEIGLMCNLEYTKPQEVLTDLHAVTEQDEKNKEESVPTTDQLLEKLNVMQDQISSLNLELESANKNMVKVKSTHKLKLKQMQKTIDNFSKMSDSNAEVSKLSEEVNQLTQKIAELEEDKGNLQLHLVDYDSGRLSESDSHRKLIELEALSEARLKAISDLETQKFDLVQELHVLQQKNFQMEDKLADLQQLQSEHVCTEMKSLQLEEQLDQAAAARKELQLVIQNLKLDKEHAKQCIKELQDKSLELSNKLESYIQENRELTDRLEKLSAEKVSSAESIEMVESLTTQEKLELEEYNKKMQFSADQNVGKENEQNQSAEDEEKTALNDSVVKLSQESAELNQKIELFTLERHEVMEKMTELKSENECLRQKIETLNVEKINYERQLEVLLVKKEEINKLNVELSNQIEKLKIEQIEVLRETSNLAKRPPSEETSVESESSSKDVLDNVMGDTTGQDDKPQASKTKPTKQLTKEILKLKNIIKEREAEIADCQMKILSLEEQNQKQMEMLKTSTMAENTIKALIEENNQLKEEMSVMKLQNENVSAIQTYVSEIEALKQNNEVLQNTVTSTQCEYLSLISIRDTKIKELENLLFDYEGKIKIYNDTLQQKDKDITEYLNQISQLNNVSQKLKSTIEVLEEEKQKDQNGELIKNLNIQIINFQNLISELETKMNILEEEKKNLMLIKSDLSEKNTSLESEINTIYNSLLEKEKCLKELHDIQNKHDEEFRRMNNQCKERDEEIHEIKLQLRKESIENENLRQTLNDLDTLKTQNTKEIDSLKEYNNEYAKKNSELIENYHGLETKNRELMEKLKKFAANLKKKTNMCTEFESQITKLHSEIEQKQNEVEKIYSKVEENATLLAQVTSLNKEIERINTEGLTFKDSKMNELESQVTLLIQEKANMIEQNKYLEDSSTAVKHELEALSIKNISLTNELQNQHQNELQLKSEVEILNNKLAEYDIEHKNNLALNIKVSDLESEVCEKQIQITNLLNEIETIQEEFNTFKFGQDAKIQERDLFIESLETEISNYRARITRLEETISIMEDRRYTLERKADQLGSQLEEKQKAYSVYSNNEDELVNRLAVLMDHDQVVEKQLKEIENENSELQNKIQKLFEVNRDLETNLQSSQEECLILKDNSNKTHQEELDSAHHRIAHLESQIKKMTRDSLAITKKAQNDINILETEFNLQLENNLKEKKILTEKCEKLLEQNTQMEHEIQQHIKSEKALTSNIDELNKINTELQDVALKHEEAHKNDYTDQYINEINNLQAIINRNNADVDTLNMHVIESKHTICSLEAKLVTFNEEIVHKEQEIMGLKKQLEDSKSEIDLSQITIEKLKSIIKDLESTLTQKDFILSHTTDITSDVEPHPLKSRVVEDLVQTFDIGSLESQIVLGDEPILSDRRSENMIRAFEHDDTQEKEPQGKSSNPQDVEEIIVPKKTYLCYDETSKTQLEQSELCTEIENDPFNSDDGWGLKEKSGIAQKNQYYTNIIADMEKVSQENEKLKNEIGNSNIKLAKALKKLKELKTNNDRLINDLKTANEMSQFNILDTTIEDELKNQIKDLEEKIAGISADLIKEKREKNTLSKQNDLFNNANDRFMEMKEKLENEVVMWKYKFKEATDKMSSFDWGEDREVHSEEPLETKQIVGHMAKSCDKSLLAQIEKENEELNLLIDQLRKEKSEQTSLQSRQRDEILSLTSELSNLKSQTEKHQNGLVAENVGLKSVIANLELKLKSLVTKNEESITCEKCNEREKSFEELNKRLETLHTENNSLITTIKHLQASIENLTLECNNYRESNNSLNTEMQILQTNLNTALGDLKHSPGTSEAEYVTAAEKSKFLEHHCETLKQDIEKALNQINNLQFELSASNEKIVYYENKKRDFENKTTKLNEENDQLLSTVAELRASISSAVDQRGYEVAEMWKQHLAQRESDFANVEHELRGQISALENKYEHLLDNVQSSSQEETSKMIMKEQFSSLQAKLKDKEDHLNSLQGKYSDLMNEMDMIRAEIEDEKVIHENKLLNQQEESEKQLAELRDQCKNDLMTKDTTISELNEELENVQKSNENSLIKLEEYSQKSQLLQSNISELVKQVNLKDSEIYEKTQEYNIIFNQRNDEFEILRHKLVEYEKKIEELSFEKESELAVLRLKMHDQLASFEKNHSKLQTDNFELEQQLTQKIEECLNFNKTIHELNKTLEEESLKMSEMRAALETQEMEIVTLKDEIEQIQILLESSAANVAKHVTFAPDTKPAADSDAGDESVSGDAAAQNTVPRAELDLALYMLHQRDMRCEELTMELTSLLEERDTLQLRLSDCLRLYEELRHKCESAGVDTSVEAQRISEKEQGTTEIPASSTSRGSVSETENLQTKLSELRSVRQMRDVRLRQDSERRDLDMQLLQRDVARLPPAAADHLRQAHYTLTRDSQSASTVLLNWLRGKSTPKVVHM